jgi:hypothetical protein
MGTHSTRLATNYQPRMGRFRVNFLSGTSNQSGCPQEMVENFQKKPQTEERATPLVPPASTALLLNPPAAKDVDPHALVEKNALTASDARR